MCKIVGDIPKMPQNGRSKGQTRSSRAKSRLFETTETVDKEDSHGNGAKQAKQAKEQVKLAVVQL